MAVEPDQRAQPGTLESLAGAVAAAAGAPRPEQALRALAEAAAKAADADVALVRLLDPSTNELVVRAVAGGPAAAAQLEGTRVPAARAHDTAAAHALGAADAIVVPVEHGDELVGTLDLLALARPLGADAAVAARVVASQLALVLRLMNAESPEPGPAEAGRAAQLASEALAAAADPAHAEAHILRVAIALSGADAAVLWRCGRELELASAAGRSNAFAAPEARAAAARALEGAEACIEHVGGRTTVAVRLGDPAHGVLQLLLDGQTRSVDELDRLAAFAARAGQTLRAVERARSTAAELEQTRALLAAVGAATEQLSLKHAVDTAIERVREFVGAERIAVYLRDEGRLVATAASGLTGPHSRVAEALLGLALGPFRARGMVAIDDAGGEPTLRPVADAISEVGIEAAVALPLVVADEVVGLLAAYPPLGRLPAAGEEAMLAALAGQLAVTVQNARLHERATRLGAELEHALDSEREAARRLGALYEISRSFAESLSLDVTVDAVARSVVEHLDVDAALIRMPDARRELLVPHALHIADEELREALRPILFRAQPLAQAGFADVRAPGSPPLLDSDAAPLLTPFLEKGSTAATVPIATSSDLIATLTLVSIDPARPITEATLELAETVATQAALAIDNARLYQQQKSFADAMHRSLMPQVRPPVSGLELGEVYAASARVDLGGDLYDYVLLPDGRLAVMLGDVTGHGVDAAADMAMAKYVFRAVVREHTRPADFVRAANAVVVDEIAPGKFITLLFLVVDPSSGEVACAAAGHPPPRIVDADGNVHPLSVRGLALGVDREQEYEDVRARLERGSSVVLYTDGVIEARADGELYGVDRLDALLQRRRSYSAENIAASVIESARQFTGGDLSDDCAVVVVKRL
jgi:serine phosphatase RsbU (regulator of sigma subunit)